MVPTVVATDLSCFLEDLGHVYFATNRGYWYREFNFEARMRGREEVFSEWQNVDMYKVKV